MNRHEPVPPTPPQLLPGRSALGWNRIILRALLVGVAMCGLAGLGYFVVPAPLGGLVGMAAMVVAIGSGVVGFGASVAGARAESRERAAGYTTVYGRKFAYWQLDPDTGAVLRAPGEREVRRRPGSSGS